MKRQRIEDILDAVLRIPEGRVANYGYLAEVAGWPGRARLVGRVLREIGEHSPVPWHRVVRADGSLAFANDDLRFDLQRELLRQEGVLVEGRRVRMGEYRWTEGEA